MADSMQPKRLNINNNIDQSKTVLDSNEICNMILYSFIVSTMHIHAMLRMQPS